jgi:AcrR family transcriptional regulator
VTNGATQTARARARATLVAEIKDAARRQLAEVGAAALSLRAIARELGMVSSAIYRYFPSRDDLLTALIVDTYNALGDLAEQTDASAATVTPFGRWLALCHAVRDWALQHEQEYALVYGSPVPGYRAPTDTIGAAARLPGVFLGVVRDAITSGDIVAPHAAVAVPAVLHADLDALRHAGGFVTSDDVTARVLVAWTLLVGAISFELFGHLNNVIGDYPTWFDHQMRGAAYDIGLRDRVPGEEDA